MPIKQLILPASFSGVATPAYDPYAGWDTTWQPLETAETWCLSVADYCDLASHATRAYDGKISNLLERHGLSVMRVSQSDWQDTYERAKPDTRGVRLTFDQWVEKTRKAQGLAFYPEVVYVVPSAKTVERSDLKAQFENPNIHANKDYLRAMLILTGGAKPAQRRASVSRLGDFKSSLIEDHIFGTTSRKDQLALPHVDTGYRGLHLTTTCIVDDASEWHGAGITAELKIEAGGMAQDVQRLTREMGNVRRATRPRETQLVVEASRYYNYVNMKKEDMALSAFCRHVHDFVYERMGLNQLLLPEPKGKRKPSDHTPVSIHQLESEMWEIAKQGVRTNNILSMNPIIPGLVRPAPQLVSAFTVS